MGDNKAPPLRSSSSRHDDDDCAIDEILSKLNEQEIEIAARSSYRYLRRRAAHDESINLDKERDQVARSMARRYLRAKKSPEVALGKMKETLAFRQEYNMDTLRLCFSSESTVSDSQRASELRSELAESMAKKEIFVQGFDKAGRALWIGVPRNTHTFEPTAYIRDAIYTLERAIACSEVNGQEQVTAVLDYAGYNPIQHEVPLHVSKKVLSILRSHYVGRLHRIYLVNAPWSMRTLWKILKPFAGRETRRKLIFVADNHEQKERMLGPVVEPSQAPLWMLPNGHLSHGRFDLKRYLEDIPFDRPYNPNDY